MLAKASPRIHPFNLEIRHLWLIVIFLSVFLLNSLAPVLPNDFWFHMKAGEMIFQTGSIPTVDTFSFTRAGLPYDSYAQYWLAEVLYFVLYRIGGLELEIIVYALAITLAYAFLFLACCQVGRLRASAIAVLFAAFLGWLTWNLRPQAFVLPLAALILWRLLADGEGKDRRNLVIIPSAILLWVNMHGTWMLGVLLVSLWALPLIVAAARSGTGLRAARDRLLVPVGLLAVAVLVSLVNPRGFGIYSYIRQMAANPVVQNIATEWQPPTIRETAGAIYIGTFFLVSLLLILSPRRAQPFELLVYVAFGVLAFQVGRGIVWFGLFMAPAIAAHLDALFVRFSHAQRPRDQARTKPGKPVLNGLIAAVLIAVGVLGTPWFKPFLPLPETTRGLVTHTPIAAVEYLRDQKLDSRVFSAEGFASYLIWAASPPYQVFLDTRFELYTLPLYADYTDISTAEPGWEAKLAEYGVGTLLLSCRDQEALIEAAGKSGSWKRLYADDTAVVFGKR